MNDENKLRWSRGAFKDRDKVFERVLTVSSLFYQPKSLAGQTFDPSSRIELCLKNDRKFVDRGWRKKDKIEKRILTLTVSLS